MSAATTTTTGTPAAGWYPDPHGTEDLRWWDGSAWTTHTTSPPDPEPEPEPVARMDADDDVLGRGDAEPITFSWSDPTDLFEVTVSEAPEPSVEPEPTSSMALLSSFDWFSQPTPKPTEPAAAEPSFDWYSPEPEAEQVAEPEVEAGPELVTEDEPVAFVEPELELVVEPEPDLVIEPEPELVVEDEPVAFVEPVVEPEAEQVAEPEAEQVAEPVVEQEPELVVEPEPDLVIEPEPEPELVAAPMVEPEPELVTEDEPEAELHAEPEVEEPVPFVFRARALRLDREVFEAVAPALYESPRATIASPIAVRVEVPVSVAAIEVEEPEAQVDAEPATSKVDIADLREWRPRRRFALAGTGAIAALAATAAIATNMLAGNDTPSAKAGAGKPAALTASERTCMKEWNTTAGGGAAQLRVTLGQFEGALAKVGPVKPLPGTVMAADSCALTVYDPGTDTHATFLAGVKDTVGYQDATSYPRASTYGWPKTAREANVSITADGTIRSY